jgi:phosphoglycolate phosphatase
VEIKMKKKDKLLILDMDNTLLQSKIDFALMHQDVTEILAKHGLAKYAHPSVATAIVNFAKSADYDPEIAAEIWQRIAEIEAIGLEKAVLEPGVVDSLDYLHDFCELAVLSNNKDLAIKDNLERLGIAQYLTCIVGRDSVPLLKPAPEGMLQVKAHYPQIAFADTITVGDAMIDAQAASAANIGFVAYNNSRMENWEKHGIEPLLELRQWNADSCRQILGLWQ